MRRRRRRRRKQKSNPNERLLPLSEACRLCNEHSSLVLDKWNLDELDLSLHIIRETSLPLLILCTSGGQVDPQLAGRGR